MRMYAIVEIPNISPEKLAHAQHLLDEETKYRHYKIELKTKEEMENIIKNNEI